MAGQTTKKKFRSQEWFDNPDNPDMTALYLERYLNYGLTRGSCSRASRSSASPRPAPTCRPATATTSSSPSACATASRRPAASPFEFPCHPIQETGKRPTAALDRNLAYLGLVEVLYGYPLDGVVLTIGCDKTTPALLMAAATVNIPAIALSVGPMLNGWYKGERTGSGTIVWKARELHVGRRDRLRRVHRPRRLLGAVDRLLQHDGHGDDDELARRGARHAAARLGRHSRRPTASAARSPTRPASASSRWCTRT